MIDQVKSQNSEVIHNKNPFNQSHFFFFVILVAVLFAVFRIFQPYLNTIVLAVILASVLNPLNEKILRLVQNRKNLAAFFSCLILFFLIVLPVVFLLTTLVQQGTTTYTTVQTWLQAGKLDKMIESETVAGFISRIQKYIPEDVSAKLNQTLIDVTSFIGRFIINQSGYLIGNITSLVAKFFLMIFIFFFVVRDGKEYLERLLHWIPLSSTHETRILDKIKNVARAVFMGVFLTSLCQGTAGGIALYIVGLPGLFLGSIMVLTSLIPFVGTALIWVPSAGFLLLKGMYFKAIFIVIWHLLVVGLMDNLLRPLFMKGSSGLSPLFILFAILGGIQLFGLIGLLYGPMIFGLAMVLLYIYELEFEQFLRHQDHA